MIINDRWRPIKGKSNTNSVQNRENLDLGERIDPNSKCSKSKLKPYWHVNQAPTPKQSDPNIRPKTPASDPNQQN